MGLGSDETPIADLGFLFRKKILGPRTSVGNTDQDLPGAPMSQFLYLIFFRAKDLQ
jgi:hypothetical protein